ncbi:alpha-amylase family glycosyl hydrolase [uncultured Piscinibacter sp.]|uniref:alpha-amylase family glycosyl hydrolase n=1 Tax=uncultured Piscinibacter sp. TaxID=1131835 RepID=UPI0026365466|nr:alpha-amylase family glycosyl hydrolase [uncultured Piscinibacter sp.]
MTTSTPYTARRRRAALALALFLAACGGGGGGGTSGPLPTVDTTSVAAADPGSALDADWRKGPFAEIFVRGYQDSDGDGVGDLKGLTGRLDYLRDLGVSGLWLMPITPSQDGDHGYAVADYRNVDPAYGTLADLDELLREAHARGIGVVVDYVMNHSAARHPAFANANSDDGNAYRDWYVFSAAKPSGWSVYGGDPWRAGRDGFYFAPFWDQMPDFNLKNATVVGWHQDNLRFWLNRGVDGFRFDAVGNLVENGPSAWENQPESLSLMAGIRQMVNGSYVNRFLVCEGPSAALQFAPACGSAFAFGHQLNLVNAARGNASAIAAVASYFDSAPAGMSTMLSNHDSFAGQRLWDQLNGNQAQYRLAAATYLLQPGTPFIYYGEEIGMAGAASLGGDPRLRTPMSWAGDARAGFTTGTPFRALSANVASNNVAAQAADGNSLLHWYKAIIALRRTHPALTRGTHAGASASGSTLSFQRVDGNQRAVVLINYSTSNAAVSAANLPANATFSNAFPPSGTDATSDANGTLRVTVPAQSLRVLIGGA